MLPVVGFQVLEQGRLVLVRLAVFLIVIIIRAFDATTLATSLLADVINFFLIFPPLIGILDLHETGGQLRLHLLHGLDAELRPDLLQLLVHPLQLVVLGLQLLLLLDVFLYHLLIKLLVLLLAHLEFVGAAHALFRALRPVVVVFRSLQFREPVRVLLIRLFQIAFCKFEGLDLLLEGSGVVLIGQRFGLLIALVDQLVKVVLHHRLVIAHVHFAFHLEFVGLIASIDIVGVHVLAHLDHFLEEHERVGRARPDLFVTCVLRGSRVV